MPALVTGATGLVGAALVRRLLDAGESVRILRRASSPLDLLGADAARVEHAVGDVTDRDAVHDATEGVDVVYHVAAAVAFGPGQAERLHAVNAGGTAAVVDAALDAGVGRLVHVSSIAALGRSARPGAPLDEQAVWTPGRANSRYAVSKRAAELEIWRGMAEGLDAVAVLPALVFGRGRPGEGTMALAERLAERRMPAAPPGATAVVDARDVAEALVRAAERAPAGARYVLAAANLPWTAILATLAEALGVPPPRRVAPGALLTLAGTLADAVAAVTGRPMGLTRETARTSIGRHAYDGSLAERELGLVYRSFEETAALVAETVRSQVAPRAGTGRT